MPSGKQILIDKLLYFSLNEINEEEEDKVSDIIRGSLLLYGSHSPDNFKCVTNISYRKVAGIESDSEKRQGIFIDKVSEFISDFIYELGALEEIPKEIKENYPSMSKDEYWSILHAASLILRALEWKNTDLLLENNKERKESLLKASIRDLNYYREDNEMR